MTDTAMREEWARTWAARHGYPDVPLRETTGHADLARLLGKRDHAQGRLAGLPPPRQ